MQRNVSTTVVAVVGHRPPPIERLAAPNVRAITVDDAAGTPLERAVAAWSQVAGVHRPYAIHDADPLDAVLDAWVALYDGVGARGQLEVATSGIVTAWRQRQVDLPDYYLVVDPDGLPATPRHWFLGVLLEAAPHRVVPVERSPPAMLAAMRQLPPGRWWPDVDRLLDDVTRAVPDRFAVAADDEAPGMALLE